LVIVGVGCENIVVAVGGIVGTLRVFVLWHKIFLKNTQTRRSMQTFKNNL
jgi:hypothetical protein